MELQVLETIVLVIHVLAALAIIGLVLIQHGKGADMGSGFGSGASATVFGSGGAGNFLTRATTSIAIIFFLTSFGLAFFAKAKSESARTVGIPVVEQRINEAAELVIPSLTNDDGSDSELPEMDILSEPAGDELPVDSNPIPRG
ncbi:MAG: preprotein translocase subunit SecG [Candidatus Azotimanducaceae bacterium]|jgi:preprotein translocase subunit SecG